MICSEQRSKIEGGFVLVDVADLMTAWRACQSQSLGIGDFRVWLGIHELNARRCLVEQGRAPSYSVAELAQLVGISERRARASVRRLGATGLVNFEPDRIEFPTQNLGVEELAQTIGRGVGSVILPRRILRLMAGGARQATIATILGILLRCLARRRGGFDGRGRLKASWVARVFGIDLRRVRSARAELVDLGWIEPEPGDQWAWNRWGRAYRIDLEWDRPGRLSLPPPPAKTGPSLPPPDLHPEPLQEFKNQEPARPTIQTGVQLIHSGSNPEPPAIQAQPIPMLPPPPIVAAPAAPALLPEPRIEDVRVEDLAQTDRTLKLHVQAVRKGLVGTSEADRLKFLALAEHARVIGQNPPALFAALLRRGAWAFITQAEEDAARRNLNAHLRPTPSPLLAPIGRPITVVPATSKSSLLSDDARTVKEICRAMSVAGYKLDPFPQFRRLNPTWDRARWDQAKEEVARARL